MRVRLISIVLLTTLAVPASAQQIGPIAIGADAMTTRVLRDAGATREFAGTVMGVQASLRLGRLQLDGTYAEGTLLPDGGPTGTAGEDYLDARLVARANLVPWLSVGVGPHLRGYVTPTGTARWARTEVHARVTTELINNVALLVLDTWYAVSAESNVQGGGVGARGGEAGIMVRIPRIPAAVHLSYMADRGTYVLGGSEFVEGVRATIALDRLIPARGRGR
jgi:hypothetical protein